MTVLLYLVIIIIVMICVLFYCFFVMPLSPLFPVNLMDSHYRHVPNVFSTFQTEHPPFFGSPIQHSSVIGIRQKIYYYSIIIFLISFQQVQIAENDEMFEYPGVETNTLVGIRLCLKQLVLYITKAPTSFHSMKRLYETQIVLLPSDVVW